MLSPLLPRLVAAGSILVVLIFSAASAVADPPNPNGAIPPQVLAKNRSPQERTKAAEESLEKALTVSWDRTAFNQVLQQLSAALQAPIVLDPEGLDEAGVTPDQLITISFEDVRVAALLDVLLDPLHMDYEVRHGMLVVTSQEKAAEHLTTRVFNVRDLLAIKSEEQTAITAKAEPPTPETMVGILYGLPPCPHKQGNWWARLMQNDAPPPKPKTPAELLIEVVSETVDAESWATAGGPGSLRVYGGMLIVNQNRRTLQKVEDLLRDLRQANAEKAGEEADE